MAILRAILITTIRWWHLSVNPILQNRYPITVKCLNIGKTIYRSISNIDTASGARTEADRMCAVAWYSNISSKADRGDIFIVHDQKSSYRTPLPSAEITDRGHRTTRAFWRRTSKRQGLEQPPPPSVHATACKYLRIMRIMMRNVLRCCDVSVLLQIKQHLI